MSHSRSTGSNPKKIKKICREKIMFNNGAFKRIYVLLVSCHFLLMFFALPISAESTYPETIRAIQALYQDELQALHNYIGFAQKAESENYPDIANLFHAFATSESIHARNFKDILSSLNSSSTPKH